MHGCASARVCECACASAPGPRVRRGHRSGTLPGREPLPQVPKEAKKLRGACGPGGRTLLRRQDGTSFVLRSSSPDRALGARRSEGEKGRSGHVGPADGHTLTGSHPRLAGGGRDLLSGRSPPLRPASPPGHRWWPRASGKVGASCPRAFAPASPGPVLTVPPSLHGPTLPGPLAPGALPHPTPHKLAGSPSRPAAGLGPVGAPVSTLGGLGATGPPLQSSWASSCGVRSLGSCPHPCGGVAHMPG